MNTRHSKVGWGFFLGWAVATLFGVLVGFIVFFLAESLLSETMGPRPDNPRLVNFLGLLIFAGSLGTVTGVAQWSVLRRYVRGSALWIGATWLGFLISSPAVLAWGGGFGPYIAPLASLRMTAAMGGALGVIQWFVLRRKVNRAGLWIVISLISWVLGGLTGMALKSLSWEMGPIYYWLGLFFFGTVLSVAGMVWLLNKNIPTAGLPAA